MTQILVINWPVREFTILEAVNQEEAVRTLREIGTQLSYEADPAFKKQGGHIVAIQTDTMTWEILQ
jgi:hypothetical protein